MFDWSTWVSKIGLWHARTLLTVVILVQTAVSSGSPSGCSLGRAIVATHISLRYWKSHGVPVADAAMLLHKLNVANALATAEPNTTVWQ